MIQKWHIPAALLITLLSIGSLTTSIGFAHPGPEPHAPDDPRFATSTASSTETSTSTATSTPVEEEEEEEAEEQQEPTPPTNTENGTPRSNSNEDITVVAFGDSLTAGVGATDENDYVSRLSRRLDSPVINAGVSGDTTADGLARLDSDVLSRNPDIVIVFLGGNDILQNVDESVTVENLTEIVEQIQAQDAAVIIVGSYRDTFISQLDSMYQQIAISTGAEFVPGALNGILGRDDLLSDAVHPNNAGYKIVTDRIWPKLRGTVSDLYPDRLLSATCLPDRDSIVIGEFVVWEAFTIGAGPQYSYEWQGDDDLQGFSSRITKRYDIGGTKTAQVTVTSGDETSEADCGQTVEVLSQPLAGLCSVAVDVQEIQGEADVSILWRSVAAGGTGEYEYSWSGSDGLSGDTAFFEKDYSSPGIKDGTVTITSGDQTLTLDCSAQLRGSMFEVDDDTTTAEPLHGECRISTGTFSTDRNVTWFAQAQGGNFPVTFDWDIDGFNGTTSKQTVSVEYSSIGTKEGIVTIADQDTDIELVCSVELVDEPLRGTRTGCFIATAAFGSYLEPHVVTLRAFRDETLLTSPLGSAFVDFYYTYSPPIAEVIEENEYLRFMTRVLLTPIVWTVAYAS